MDGCYGNGFYGTISYSWTPKPANLDKKCIEMLSSNDFQSLYI